MRYLTTLLAIAEIGLATACGGKSITVDNPRNMIIQFEGKEWLTQYNNDQLRCLQGIGELGYLHCLYAPDKEKCCVNGMLYASPITEEQVKSVDKLVESQLKATAGK